QSRRGGRTGRARARHSRSPSGHGAAGRAPHEPGDAGVRSRRRPRLRPQDRRGSAGGGATEPRRHPRLSRQRRIGLMAAILTAEDVRAQYGWTRVLHGVSFAVEEGGITTILGANGAGKTTTLRAVSGLVATEGALHFGGRRIDGRAPEELVRMGIAHV